MPNDGKVCTFDCLYCEAGFNAQGPGTTGLPTRAQVATDLETKLAEMHAAGQQLDVITFSGNGEPTLHPDFNGIIDDTIALRDRFYPEARVSVLSNATRLDRPDVVSALGRVDNNILKLDSAIADTVALIDRPTSPAYDVNRVIAQLSEFGANCIVQTMLLRGTYNGHTIDNTTTAEIEALIDAYRTIRPAEVMLYSIDRQTPARQLVKVPSEELEAIADRIRQAGIKVVTA